MGRKVPLSHSIPKPSAKEIASAAERLGLNPSIEEKKYPKKWWEEKERMIVEKRGSKRKVLLMIAEELKKGRQNPPIRAQEQRSLDADSAPEH